MRTWARGQRNPCTSQVGMVQLVEGFVAWCDLRGAWAKCVGRFRVEIGDGIAFWQC